MSFQFFDTRSECFDHFQTLIEFALQFPSFASVAESAAAGKLAVLRITPSTMARAESKACVT